MLSFGIKNKGYISNCNYSSALIHAFLFFHYGNRILLVSFFYFVKEYNIETESTIDQYCTLLGQWDCRYFVRFGYHRILIKLT